MKARAARFSRKAQVLAAALALTLIGARAQAAPLQDAGQSLWWGFPFLGLLVSIGLGPLVAASFWPRHYGKVALAWAAALALALTLRFGPQDAFAGVVHALIGQYLPFITMMFALYVAAGGIVLRGATHGRPALNTLLLAFGTLAASLVGVIAASMILIRPLLRANDERRSNAHVVIFFIFLVSNIGGALTPLGNPPLFLGYLAGVDFFWPLHHQWAQTLFVALALLVLFFVIDNWLLARETNLRAPHDSPMHFSGAASLFFLILAVAVIVVCGVWRPGVDLSVLGEPVALQEAVRDGAMIVIGVASYFLTGRAARRANGFEWEPFVEVAKVFAAIFVCMAPLFPMLEAGANGPLGALVGSLADAGGAPRPVAYFWFTGLLSAALDNAPTYLIAFELAGGEPARLMGEHAGALRAIGLGAAFMGALTYIGNAPNFMIYAIARRAGVRMPGFFGYMVWSGAILIPLFAIVSLML